MELMCKSSGTYINNEKYALVIYYIYRDNEKN